MTIYTTIKSSWSCSINELSVWKFLECLMWSDDLEIFIMKVGHKVWAVDRVDVILSDEFDVVHIIIFIFNLVLKHWFSVFET